MSATGAHRCLSSSSKSVPPVAAGQLLAEQCVSGRPLPPSSAVDGRPSVDAVLLVGREVTLDVLLGDTGPSVLRPRLLLAPRSSSSQLICHRDPHHRHHRAGQQKKIWDDL